MFILNHYYQKVNTAYHPFIGFGAEAAGYDGPRRVLKYDSETIPVVSNLLRAILMALPMWVVIIQPYTTFTTSVEVPLACGVYPRQCGLNSKSHAL